MTDTTPLTTLIYLPLLGALALLAIPKNRDRAHWAIAIGASLLTLVPFLAILRDFRPHITELQFLDTVAALDAIGLGSTVGLDGINLWFVGLATLLTPVALLGSIGRITYRARDFAALVLLVEGSAIGVFCAQDLLTLFIFWVIVLLALYLLFRGWGGEEGPATASRFALYTGSGSLLLLIALLAIYNASGGFGYETIATADITPEDASWIAITFGLGFLLQMAIFPFHGWYCGALAQAAIAPSILITGILVNMGAYGFIRFVVPLFPETLGGYSIALVGVSALGVVFGALTASGHSALRKVISYASISNLSLVLLGVLAFNEQSLQGSIVLLICHSLAVTCVLLVQHKIDVRGVATAGSGTTSAVSPGLKVLFSLSILCLIGIPLTGNFIGQFLVISASFGEGLPIYPGLGITDWPVLVVIASGLACLSIILAATYGIKLLRSFGTVASSESQDELAVSLSRLETGILVPLIVTIFGIGVSPGGILKHTETSTNQLVEMHRSSIQLARDSKRIGIRLEKRKRATRPGPGRLKGPEAGQPSGKKVRVKGRR